MTGKVFDTVLWCRLDTPGHDFCLVSRNESGYSLTGTTNFIYQAKSCSLHYAVECQSDWTTQSAWVRGYIGRKSVDLEMRRHADATWALNGEPQPQVAGCGDIDLSFTPATNILAIRGERLRSNVETEVLAAWLKFPQLNLTRLQQTYTKLASDRYRYTAEGGKFRTILRVRPSGLVSSYPGLWRAENAT